MRRIGRSRSSLTASPTTSGGPKRSCGRNSSTRTAECWTRYSTLSRVLKERPGVKLDRRPRLADWGYYAAAAYEVFGWGSKQFEADWKAVVDAQNRETREGSALAQAIFEIMEVHNYYSATPDKLLEALETEAEKLKIDIKRDKKWPNAPS